MSPPKKEEPDPTPVDVDVDGFEVPRPGKEVGFVEVPIAPGLEAVAPPKKDPVPVPAVVVDVHVVSFVPRVEVPNPPRGGGFFLVEPDNPSTAG